jgi:hypothetical protein
MTDWTLVHPAELAQLRMSMRVARRAASVMTLAVVCSLAAATAIMVAALTGSI